MRHIAKGVMMETMIFSGHGMFITKENSNYFINFDEGGIVNRDVRYEINEQEALKARRSGQDAYEVMLISQSRASKYNL
jgi:hypothetical protein